MNDEVRGAALRWLGYALCAVDGWLEEKVKDACVALSSRLATRQELSIRIEQIHEWKRTAMFTENGEEELVLVFVCMVLRAALRGQVLP